jgi:hypothetical protein
MQQSAEIIIGQSHLDFAADRRLENYGKQTEQPPNESSL